MFEKDLTLAMAMELRRQIVGTGRFTVKLTREDDVAVRLRDRAQIAHDAGAALFISLHADSMPRPTMRGMSVYTLSEEASDEEAAALAAKENKADIIAGIDLSDHGQVVNTILIDLAQRETKNSSVRFAGKLLEELARDVKQIRKAHRFAGFAVLKDPVTPSVLVELGYLSNREDEALLKSPAHRRKIAAGMLRAIERYFDKVAVVSNR